MTPALSVAGSGMKMAVSTRLLTEPVIGWSIFAIVLLVREVFFGLNIIFSVFLVCILTLFV